MNSSKFFRSAKRLVVLSLAALGLPAAASAAVLNATYNAATEVPLTANGYTATGNSVNLTLNFAPVAGTELTVVRNTSVAFIAGTFSNLTNGQPVALSYDGATYSFVADYFGGSGNDLVLVWAHSRPFGWGDNYDGELGDGTQVDQPLPVPMITNGLLAGKTVIGFAVGEYHSLVRCADGTVAALGFNESGQLGDNTTSPHTVPVAVNTTAGVSALYGKTVVALAAGFEHSLALCSDGTVAAWGYNYNGQLGDNSRTNRLVPVGVNTNAGVSALYGKTVVAIAACNSTSLALCSDGTVAAWGRNTYGQLGNGTNIDSPVPVAVNTAAGSALHGKTVVNIAAASGHCLALCSDSTVTAWGANDEGELGNNTTTSSLVPVSVNADPGVSALYDKTVTAIAAGAWHSQALCSDGTVVTWGYNYYGQLGDGTTTDSWVPLAVNAAPGSALFRKKVTAITMGSYSSLALCSDGTVAGWGLDNSGQLGDGVFVDSQPVPVAVNATNLAPGERFMRLSVGSYANHNLALAAATVVAPIRLTGATRLANGSFQFIFTGFPGTSYSVVSATNPLLSLGGWTSVTGLTEPSPGLFQFTDRQATNSPRRFYRVRLP